MAFSILNSARVQRILQALSPRFIGRDQDHLLALADEAADAGYSAAYDYVQPLYDFRETIESPAGASDVGITDAGGHYTSTDVEGALQEVAVIAAAHPITSVFGRTGAITANSGDYTFAKIGSTPTTLSGYGITDAAPLSHVGAGGTAHSNVVASGAAGFMSGTDKAKLDGIASGAQVNTVTSVFGRTGLVSAASGDYTFAQIGSKPTTLGGYGITDAVDITSTQSIGGSKTFNLTVNFGGAANFGSVVGSSITDLSKHIQLHTAGYGFNVTSGTLNYTTGASGSHQFNINGTVVAALTSTNAGFTGSVTSGGLELGYRGIPTTAAASGNYTFVATDAGKMRQKTGTSAATYTCNSGVFASDDVHTVVNNATAGNITLTPGGGVTMRLAGTTSRTIAPLGIATILWMSPSACFVMGPGVT